MERIHDEVSEQIIESARRLATERGTGRITVRDVLKDMNITNRVFYNRYRNIDEVMDIIYVDMARSVRESLSIPWQEGTDFFEHVKQVAVRTLILSYETRQNLSQFVFEADSASGVNFAWWDGEIKKLIAAGQKSGSVKSDIDADMLSYSIWCFIRGFNADAITRDLPREEAEKRFLYGFGVLLDGVKA